MANRTYHPRGKLVHGYSVRQHPSYFTWARMLARCYNPDDAAFKNYGGRGIAVDPTWHHFENFAVDMGLTDKPGLSIERIDNDGGYCKTNCKWGTRVEQAWNRRTFSNNTSGSRGVIAVGGDRWLARFDYEKQRYQVGRYGSVGEAEAARSAFIGLFFRDRKAALEMLDRETIWCTSSTGVRGVTPHVEGGFIARTTVKGQRVYCGYFQTVEEAAKAIAEAKKNGVQ